MKMVRKSVAVILCFMMLVSGMAQGICGFVPLSKAYGQEVEGFQAPESFFEYEIQDSSAVITSYKGYHFEKLIIPSVLGGYPVTKIGDNAFEWDTCDELVLPVSLKEIGARVFRLNKTVTIPENVSVISKDAFLESERVEEINVSEENMYFSSEDGVLFSKDKTELIFYPPAKGEREYKIPDGVKIIGENAFAVSTASAKPLSHLIMPDSVVEIGNYAFEGSNILRFDISDNLKKIGDYAFSYCFPLIDFELPDSLEVLGECALLRMDFDELHIPASVKEIGENALDIYGKVTLDENSKYFEADENGILYTKGKTELVMCLPGYEVTELTIPDSVKIIRNNAFADCDELEYIDFGKGVESIGESAFDSCVKLTEVIFSPCLKEIGALAFNHCYNLKEFELPSSLKKVDFRAFAMTKIESIVIPDGVEQLGENVFCDCRNLESITFGKSITHIPEHALSGCYSLSNVVFNGDVVSVGSFAFNDCFALKNLTVPASVEKIELQAFAGASVSSFDVHKDNPYFTYENKTLYNKDKTQLIECYDKLGDGSFVVPESVKKIGDSAFSGCRFESIILPCALTEIGNGAFENCLFSEIELPSALKKIDERAFMDSSLDSITLPASLEAIGDFAFASCLFTELVLPSSLKEIGDYAFRDTLALENITIPVTLEKIGEGIFSRSGVKNVTFSKGITVIPVAIFSDCDKIESVTLPEGVKTIGYDAFSHCDSLKNVSLPSTLEKIESFAFFSCTALNQLTIGDNVTSIGDAAFSRCTSLESITLPRNLRELEAGLFEGCFALKDVTLPEELEVLGENAFLDCVSLREINIPSSVTDMGESVFYGSAIESIVIPENVKIIPDSAFKECRNLKNVVLPQKLEVIADQAFSFCPMTSIDIGPELKIIGDNALLCCEKLEQINVHKDNKYFKTDASGNLVTKDSSVLLFVPSGNVGETYFVPEGIKETAEGLFAYNTTMKKVVLPDSLEVIGVCTFNECRNIEWVSFSGNLRRIGEGAFAGCASLTHISFPEKLESIDSEAFTGCEKLSRISFADSDLFIADKAFGYCEALSLVRLPGKLEYFDSSAFEGCDNLYTFVLPDTLRFLIIFSDQYVQETVEYKYVFNAPEGEMDCWWVSNGPLDRVSFINAPHTPGDYDKNGKIEATDARLVLRASVGLETPDDSSFYASDVDCNAKVTAADARLILRASVGLETLE